MCIFVGQNPSCMMRILWLLCLLTLGWAANAQTALPRPRLVVGIVIDQMRWDYLYRYYDRYGTGGFKRLMNEGYNCQNTFINYLPAFTAPGHAAIYTGSVPAIHGIAANDWMDNLTCTKYYCTDDTAAHPVGGYKGGSMSPSLLLTTTITDELRLATNKRSRVFGISLKDRSSILPAGHMANGAYWLDDSTGNFMSSSYYGKALPGWLVRFNTRRIADSLMTQPWTLLYPANTYTQSLPDSNQYEKPIKGAQQPVFPHVTRPGDYFAMRHTPAGTVLTFMAAKACISGEQLGGRGFTDFLCLSIASTDYAGHEFTPNSVEMEDMFLRLDADLADFLTYLDKQVGKGQYTLFLTADHGGAHNAHYLQDNRVPAGDLIMKEFYKNLDKYLQAKTGKTGLVSLLTNYQVYLNEPLISEAGLDRNQVKSWICSWFAQQPGIANAIDMEGPGIATVPQPIRDMIVNGYNRQRSGVIQLVTSPAWYSGHRKLGTDHGTWSPYDTHIPLLWYGWGIQQGNNYHTLHITDIAPTLAALLHIQMPNGCVGKVIPQLIKQ